MTEVGFATQMPNDIEVMDDSGSVGIRAPFREVKLINEDGSPTETGEVGEMWVRGRGIIKGYWNRPEANINSFDGEWFKTGDLLRADEHGFLWLIGRIKDMIKRSGENIAAREVETVIREITEINEVAAIPIPDKKRGEEVMVYIELIDALTPDDWLVKSILEHARKKLAVFKVPRYIAFLSPLPRTPTNKIRKGELEKISKSLSGVYDSEEKCWY